MRRGRFNGPTKSLGVQSFADPAHEMLHVKAPFDLNSQLNKSASRTATQHAEDGPGLTP